MPREEARAATGPPVVLVSGASRGIGSATALWLGRAAARVALLARSEAALEEVAAQVRDQGGEALIIVGDLAQPAMASQAVRAALDQWGRLDAVVNNAATVHPMQRVVDADVEHWSGAMVVNVLAPFLIMQSAIPALRRTTGRIITLSSTAASLPIAGLSAYCVTKAALAQLTRVVAEEEPAITALSVQPGPVDTDMHVALREDERQALAHERHEYYLRLHNAGELVSPDVPGRSIAWLALHAPRAWTGQEIHHDDPRVTGPAAGLVGQASPKEGHP